MKRIDFLGAAGVGKSTVYSALIQQREKKEKLFTVQEAKVKIAQKYYWKKNKSIDDWCKLVAISLPLPIKVRSLVAAKLLHRQNEIKMWNDRYKFSSFFDAILKGTYLNERDMLRRVLGVKRIYDLFEDVMLIEGSDLPGIVVCDDSLSQKIYAIAEMYNFSTEDVIEKYFNTFPIPQAVIHFSNEPHVVLSHVKKRTKEGGETVQWHRDVDNKELLSRVTSQLKISKIGADILVQRGVPVLKIETTKAARENAQRILQFIDSL